MILSTAEIISRWTPGSADPPWTWEDERRDLEARDGARLDELEADIRTNGIREPVELGSDGRVWGGHHRIVLAMRNGWPTLPVTVYR